MDAFATIWGWSPDPIGMASILAVLVGASSIAIVWGLREFWPGFSKTTEWISPVFFLALSAVKEGSPVMDVWWRGWAPPDGPDYIAGAIYLALGFGFALANLRQVSLPQRLTGVAFTFVFGTFVVGEAASKVPGLLYERPQLLGWQGNALWPSLIAFWVIWAIVVIGIWISLSRRVARRTSTTSPGPK